MLKWFKSHLTGRFQIVQVNGNFSNRFKVASGVHRVLSWVLCYLEVEFSQMELFADDCRLSMRVSDADDMMKLQSDIDKVGLWFLSHKLKVNKSKYQKITYCRKKIPSDNV